MFCQQIELITCQGKIYTLQAVHVSHDYFLKFHFHFCNFYPLFSISMLKESKYIGMLQYNSKNRDVWSHFLHRQVLGGGGKLCLQTIEILLETVLLRHSKKRWN